MRQLVLTGPVSLRRTLRLMSDDEIWEYLMADSKHDPAENLTWDNLDEFVRTRLQVVNSFWKKRCARTNPSWARLYQEKEEAKEYANTNWFRTWCLLYMQYASILTWANARMLGFSLHVHDRSTLQEFFAFLGEKANDPALATAVVDQLFARLQPAITAAQFGATKVEFYLTPGNNQWLTPVCTTPITVFQQPLGGVRRPGLPEPTVVEPMLGNRQEVPQDWRVFRLTPETRLACLLVGVAQRMTAETRGDTYGFTFMVSAYNGIFRAACAEMRRQLIFAFEG